MKWISSVGQKSKYNIWTSGRKFVIWGPCVCFKLNTISWKKLLLRASCLYYAKANKTPVTNIGRSLILPIGELQPTDFRSPCSVSYYPHLEILGNTMKYMCNYEIQNYKWHSKNDQKNRNQFNFIKSRERSFRLHLRWTSISQDSFDISFMIFQFSENTC